MAQLFGECLLKMEASMAEATVRDPAELQRAHRDSLAAVTQRCFLDRACASQ